MNYKSIMLIITLFLSGCTTTKPTLTDSYLYQEQIRQEKQQARDIKDRISTDRVLERINLNQKR